jgi:hypothetical protein
MFAAAKRPHGGKASEGRVARLGPRTAVVRDGRARDIFSYLLLEGIPGEVRQYHFVPNLLRNAQREPVDVSTQMDDSDPDQTPMQLSLRR